jgi:hypothetical protein
MKLPSKLLPLLLVAIACVAIACAAKAPEPAPEWPLACTLFPPDADAVTACARRDAEGEIALRPGVVASEDAPGAVLVEGELYFALATGKTAPALWFDNGPDYFVEGLARTVRGGKVGFVNQELDVVVPRQWDFAFPFEGGFAQVCTGCVIVQEAGDEHSSLQGGAWGRIDREGRIVVPVEYPREELPPPP